MITSILQKAGILGAGALSCDVWVTIMCISLCAANPDNGVLVALCNVSALVCVFFLSMCWLSSHRRTPNNGSAVLHILAASSGARLAIVAGFMLYYGLSPFTILSAMTWYIQ